MDEGKLMIASKVGTGSSRTVFVTSFMVLQKRDRGNKDDQHTAEGDGDDLRSLPLSG